MSAPNKQPGMDSFERLNHMARPLSPDADIKHSHVDNSAIGSNGSSKFMPGSLTGGHSVDTPMQKSNLNELTTGESVDSFLHLGEEPNLFGIADGTIVGNPIGVSREGLDINGMGNVDLDNTSVIKNTGASLKNKTSIVGNAQSAG